MSIENENENTNVEATNVTPTVEELQAELAKKDELLKATRAEAAERRVAAKSFEGVDIEEYRQLKAAAAEQAQKELESKGKFEEAKEAIVTSYNDKLNVANEKLSSLESQLTALKVNDGILSAAAKQNALNPEQIVLLLKDNVKLNSEGQVEVVNAEGKTQFDENGNLVSVDEYVSTYLSSNSHLVRGVSAGTGSTGGQHKAATQELRGGDRIAAALAARRK